MKYVYENDGIYLITDSVDNAEGKFCLGFGTEEQAVEWIHKQSNQLSINFQTFCSQNGILYTDDLLKQIKKNRKKSWVEEHCDDIQKTLLTRFCKQLIIEAEDKAYEDDECTIIHLCALKDIINNLGIEDDKKSRS